VHLQHKAARANYFDAAGAAAEAEADASAAFFFLLVFLALGAGVDAEADAEAAAGAEAGASAANAEAANRPAIKAAISFFILTSLYQVVEGRSIRINRSGITSTNEWEFLPVDRDFKKIVFR
jgi:hypothetical protein